MPTCSYKIQDTKVASVCSNPAAVSSVADGPTYFPSSSNAHVYWRTGDTAACASKNAYDKNYALIARKDVDNGYQEATSPVVWATATDVYSVCMQC